MEGNRSGRRLFGTRRRGTQPTSRASTREWLWKCHWPVCLAFAGGSDYQDRKFGRDWVPFSRARAVFLIDRAGDFCYGEIVPEITSEPDYASALNVLFDLV